MWGRCVALEPLVGVVRQESHSDSYNIPCLPLTGCALLDRMGGSTTTAKAQPGRSGLLFTLKSPTRLCHFLWHDFMSRRLPSRRPYPIYPPAKSHVRIYNHCQGAAC